MVNKTLYLFGFFFLFWQVFCVEKSNAQIKIPNWNWGVRLGLNAVSVKSYEASIYNEILPNSSHINKNGYLVTAFTRFNMKRIFLQPELVWNEYNRTCSFSLPFENNEGYSYPSDLNINSSSINANFLAGYNIVYDYPFLFGIFTGVALAGTYQNKYSLEFEPKELYIKKDLLFNITGIIGISINISKIYFDLRYEMGLPKDLILREIPDFPERYHNVKINKTESILSFSCGVMF